MSRTITINDTITKFCVQCCSLNIIKLIKGNCDKCYLQKWRLRNPIKVKEYQRKYNNRRLVFKDRVVYLKFNPRTGKCNKCLREVGKGIKQTLIHHIQYHEEDVLLDICELCTSCHNSEHWRLRKGKENE